MFDQPVLRILLIASLAGLSLCAPAGAAAAPRNGRIVFGELSKLFSVRPDGSHRQRLTDGWSHSGLAPSPDGRSLVTAADGRLALISPSTGEEVGEVPVQGKRWIGSASWSPGGGELAFHACDKTEVTDVEECVRYGVYTIRRDGSRMRRVAEGIEPSWSRDGKRLTFMHSVRPHDSGGNECYGIYVARRDGSRLRRVLPRRDRCHFGGDFDVEPVFGPGDARIIFTREHGIVSVRLDGRDARRLVSIRRGYLPGAARLSPDGRRLLYALRDFRRSGVGIQVTSPRGGGRGRRIATASRPTNALAWLPVASR